jgi:hypothetical protein
MQLLLCLGIYDCSFLGEIVPSPKPVQTSDGGVPSTNPITIFAQPQKETPDKTFVRRPVGKWQI